MIKTIKEFFQQKTDNLSFMNLKEESNILVNGYRISSTVPLPIVIDELVEEIKMGKAEEEMKISSFVDGMIYVLGVVPEFKHSEEYKRILYKYNENIEDYILYKGQKLIEENVLDDAIIYMRSLVTINNQNIKGLFNYATTLEMIANKYYRIKQNRLGTEFLKKSTQIFEDITDIEPEFALSYYKLGFHYISKKEFKKAQIIWEKFFKLDDNEDRIEEIQQNLLKIQDNVMYEEGYCEILRGNTNAGMEKLLPLKEKYTDWWNLLFMIGLGYRQLERYGEAKKEFENVLAINPEQVDTLNELGLCLANLGLYRKAIEKFTLAIEKRPKDYEIICNRGMTYLQIGELDNAIRDIEMAYKENPKDEITIRCKKEIDRITNMA